ncbi:MAG: ribonuclease III [Defluviitaleaceae bacterium]|nr:ribonuclease III [Defluviitaleaceae bacterium]
MTHNENLSEFLEKEGIPFKHLAVYIEAFTHSSYSNERRHITKLPHNERLEFLGDAALQLCCSEYLFDMRPELPEGNMTRIRSALVREEALDKYADQINLPAYVRMGRGEEKMGGRSRASLKADAFEALVGAIYEDLGFDHVLTFLTPILEREYLSLDVKDDRDYKSRLQEFVQADSKRAINYHIMSAEGPAHAKIFEIAVMLDDMMLGVGSATTKKEAEQLAAKEALSKLALQD